jgi:hypothetical protein
MGGHITNVNTKIKGVFIAFLLALILQSDSKSILTQLKLFIRLPHKET